MTNIGSLDRAIRFLVGAALILTPFLAPALFEAWGAWRFLVIAIGLVLVVTAALRVCPAYLLFGIRTCARQGG